MANFTTRVELHETNGKKPDYEILHTEMEAVGFTRTIQVEGDDKIYKLPTAEYNYAKKNNTLTTEEVLELAKKAAAKTKFNFSVLVTKADGRREWHNLSTTKH